MLIAPLQEARQSAAATIIATEEPVAVISAIYRQAIKEAASSWLEPKERRKYLSKSLLALWAKADAKKPPDGDAGPIDFDLTADTNGLTLESFTARLQIQTADTATVAVELVYQKPYVRSDGPFVVTYDFLRETGGWKIDNIHTKRWSVRDLLTRWLKDA
ncbi:hypothetical protein [Methyloferula stellata]|uniref:hypothetical protein n=1 Tax=Methyloferula stellata TaxID=876270 RepID=UPI000362BA33|nr:hypothetical protein [Methyloferula stellata]